MSFLSIIAVASLCLAECFHHTADTVAKMIACTLSREVLHTIGFLWPWTFPHTGTHAGPRAYAGDIPTAHMPAEAAYYTAGALIDGFDYTRLELGPDIQAARFGMTVMLWSTGQAREVGLPLENDGPWVVVDVVGRARNLPVDENNYAILAVSPDNGATWSDEIPVIDPDGPGPVRAANRRSTSVVLSV
jgi:hypothetical protein